MENKYFLTILILSTLASCNNNSKLPRNKEQNINLKYCYEYISNKDSVFLEIDVIGQDVTGNLKYRFYEKDKNEGQILGTLKGDTLLASYKFLSEGRESIREVAFLRTSEGLLEGYGDVEEKNGKMVFKNTSSIVFNSGYLLKNKTCFK